LYALDNRFSCVTLLCKGVKILGLTV